MFTAIENALYPVVCDLNAYLSNYVLVFLLIAMYRSEASQLDAMIRFIRVNGLLDDLKRKDWASFARAYNGSGYAKNQYDKKLAAAYRKYA